MLLKLTDAHGVLLDIFQSTDYLEQAGAVTVRGSSTYPAAVIGAYTITAYTPPATDILSPNKTAKILAVIALASYKTGIGFPCTLDAQAETLQLRDQTDRTNWLALMLACQINIGAGNGAGMISPGVRTTANRTHAMTYSACITLLGSLLTWASSMQGNIWLKVDAITAAIDQTSLGAIDITTGWPS
jgi:hypothetical protein